MPDSSTDTAVAPLSSFTILRHLVRAAPLTVPPSASVRETLLSSMQPIPMPLSWWTEASHVPLGIVTLRDVLRRIAIEAGDLDAPIAVIMTGGLITLPASATAHQASVIMVRRSVRHLVLTEPDGSYFNLVSQADLYAQTGSRAAELVSSILAARDILLWPACLPRYADLPPTYWPNGSAPSPYANVYRRSTIC